MYSIITENIKSWKAVLPVSDSVENLCANNMFRKEENTDKNGEILSESNYRVFEERWEQNEGESYWLISKGFSIVE